MRIAIDSLAYPEIEPNLFLPVVGLFAIVLFQFVIYFPARRVMRRISISITYDLRKRVFHNIQYQGSGFFNKYSTGDLMSRAHNDVNQVRMAASWGWLQLITIAFQFVTSLSIMFYMSLELTLWVLIPTPLVGVCGWFMARGMYPYFRERQEAQAAVSTFAQENLNGIRTIQAMAQEDHEIARFRQVATTYIKKFYRAVRYQQFMMIIMGTLSTISPLLILTVGGFMVINGELTIGVYTAFNAYLMMLVRSVTSVGWSLSMFTSAAAATERIFEIVDHEPEVKDTQDDSSDAIQDAKGTLEIRDLFYTYPDASIPALNKLNLRLDAGETIALLGRVGSGKSSILRAAVRLIDTPQGTIFVDGKDVCDLSIADLRKLVGLVPQYPFLFSATIQENITYDDPERHIDAVWEAAIEAGLAPTIEDATDGMETLVGERGITLSGGQKQRVTLARGLIRHTPILLLDDCFSSVDTETEERIIEGLHWMRENKSTILISHRVSTARHADRIYVIDNGAVLEEGTHEELLEKGGYYADLEAVQSNESEDESRKERLLATLESDDSSESTDELAETES